MPVNGDLDAVHGNLGAMIKTEICCYCWQISLFGQNHQFNVFFLLSV